MHLSITDKDTSYKEQGKINNNDSSNSSNTSNTKCA